MKLFFKTLQMTFLFCLPLFLGAQDWSLKQAPLMTRWVNDLNVSQPLPEYPRPQMVRTEWLNLNGLWEFQVGAVGDPVPEGKELERQILVPFPVESALSGVMEQHERVWYRRSFSIPAGWQGKHILLHFGAIDWESEVFINGKSMGVHQGGYDEISYDITDYISDQEEQELIVRVYDPTEGLGIPRGKQETPPHKLLIMYTPVTGIWQTVWIEPVEVCHIENLRIVPDVDKSCLKLTVNAIHCAEGKKVTAMALDGEKVIATVSGKPGEELSISINQPKLWSPDSPFLYDLNVELSDETGTLDKIVSYFGMRKISLEQSGEHKKLFLNNEFVYNFGFLDQGFWPDGIYTAPTDEALKFDVQIQKDFGYNMVRKHLKVEPQRWYYWADKLGIMVWQDMPSANSYRQNPPPVDTVQYAKELERMIDGHFNSPSITTWVIYNETQGQKTTDGTNLTQRMVDIVRAKDSTRLINPASDNIYKDYIGDILDYHAYPAPKGVESKTMATACGEFGSVGLVVKEHEWMPDSGVSMIMVNTPKDLEDIYEGYIHMLAEFKSTHGMSGAVFTQLTDVEQEINGFLTYDRVSKVNVPKIRAINERLINQQIKHKENLLATASDSVLQWRYTIIEPAGKWSEPNFDDSTWNTGEAGFGAGDPPRAVINTEWKSPDIWMRSQFEVGEIAADETCKYLFKVYHDEDFEIYINGVLAASVKGHSTDYVTIPVNSVGEKVLIPNGKNTIAVHCHQTGGGQFIDVGLLKVSYCSDSK